MDNPNKCWDGGVSLDQQQHKAVPAPFLTKTYQLVDDPSTDHIVSWGEDGCSTFVVWRPPEFARDILPNYFKHNNFSSFVRQLNTYGFRKIVPERWEFANEFFRKGEKNLLCEIHRRKTNSSITSLPSVQPFSEQHFPLYQFSAYEEPHRLLLCSPAVDTGLSVNSCRNGNDSATALLEENEWLRRSNAVLLSELAHMRRLYNDIIYFVQNHVKPVAPSSPSVNPQLLLSGFYGQRNGGLNNSGSTTSSSSLTIAEEHNTNGESSSTPSPSSQQTKLFGVNLSGGGCSSNYKRVLESNQGGSLPLCSSTKPRLVLEKDDLGLNLKPSSHHPPPSC